MLKPDKQRKKVDLKQKGISDLEKYKKQKTEQIEKAKTQKNAQYHNGLGPNSPQVLEGSMNNLKSSASSKKMMTFSGRNSNVNEQKKEQNQDKICSDVDKIFEQASDSLSRASDNEVESNSRFSLLESSSNQLNLPKGTSS